MKIAKRILNIVLDVILILLLFVSTVVVITTITQQKTGVPSAFGYTIQAVQSDSMDGIFNKGDVIISKSYDGKGVSEGEIVSFKSMIQGQEAIITHRIDEITEDGKIYTKGDANPIRDDGFIVEDEVLCIYVDKIKGLGSVIDFLKKPLGFILFIVTPISLYIIYQVIYLIRLYVVSKKEEMLEQAKEGTSDDVKDAIIKEYLAKIEAEKNKENESNLKTEN